MQDDHTDYTDTTSATQHRPIRPGDVIGGRYRVDSCIAEGGQASVWRATQENLQRTVAIKVLTPPPDGDQGEPFQERFQLEAHTLAALNHPNIVVVYDYGEVGNGTHYLAMEYIDGVRISDVFRQRPLPIRRGLHLILEACKALRYAHNRGVIHRDVKGANILVSRNGDGEYQAKVVDFGLVRLQESASSITQEGIVLGSPHFMAPEQIRGEAFDHRADIYAVGVLLHCATTGRYPYTGRTAHQVMHAHLTKPVPDLVIQDPMFQHNAGLKQTIQRALAKDPDQRFPFMDDLINELQRHAEPSASQPVRPQASTADSPPIAAAEGDEEGLVDAITVRDEQALPPIVDTPVQPATPSPTDTSADSTSMDTSPPPMVAMVASDDDPMSQRRLLMLWMVGFVLTLLLVLLGRFSEGF